MTGTTAVLDGRRPARVIVLAAAAAIVVAVVVVAVSRAQLATGGPGVMAASVPVPAAAVLIVAAVAAATARSFRAGLGAGLVALVACFVTVAVVVALEGLVWMERLGVWALDADPPQSPATVSDVALDFFSTGLWIGHLAFWVPFAFLGAALGSRLGKRGS